jgi:hypothetical protein
MWEFLGGLAVGATYLAGRAVRRRSQQSAAAHAAGLEPAANLSHVSTALQRSALWALADGGFERRVLHGVLSRVGGDVSVTAFDLETLRERRGEWAFLPVEPPFRIAGVVSAVATAVDRRFPHVLFKRVGRGDELADDSYIERIGDIAKLVRDRLGLARSYESELPATLPAAPLSVTLPEHWRAYTSAPEYVASLLGGGLAATLQRGSRRDLVVELIEDLVLVYPAARDVVGPDAFADLTTTALEIVDGLLAATPPLTPRGVESRS